MQRLRKWKATKNIRQKTKKRLSRRYGMSLISVPPLTLNKRSTDNVIPNKIKEVSY